MVESSASRPAADTSPRLAQETAHNGRTIVFVCNRAMFFSSHRRNLAEAMARKGWRTILIAPLDSTVPALRSIGVTVVESGMSRGWMNPFADFGAMAGIAATLRRENPQIVHLITLKAIVLGLIASYAAPRARYVIAFAGLGRGFSTPGVFFRFMRVAVLAPLRWFVSRRDARIVVQNNRDLDVVRASLRLEPAQLTLIRGSGIDLSMYDPRTREIGVPVVLFASRLLVPKGIGVFLEAAAELVRGGAKARFVVAGELDTGGADCIDEQVLLGFVRQGIVDWVGNHSDVPRLLREASMLVLPTWYGEGVPRIILEAAAAGRPVITTDIPGCRDVVEDGVTGVLIPPRDRDALVDAIKTLLEHREVRIEMGQRARQRAEAEFRVESVTAAHLEVYGV